MTGDRTILGDHMVAIEQDDRSWSVESIDGATIGGSIKYSEHWQEVCFITKPMITFSHACLNEIRMFCFRQTLLRQGKTVV